MLLLSRSLSRPVILRQTAPHKRDRPNLIPTELTQLSQAIAQQRRAER
ncbi:MAG TPA: hypothetical protein V6C95_21050 [Coleofasciculaceae cyanobacterium]